jgi:hypothetical protein
MKKLFRKVQFASIIAIIAIAFLLGLLVIKEFSGTPGNAAASRQPPSPNANVSQKQPNPINPLGKSISLEDIDWAKKQTDICLVFIHQLQILPREQPVLSDPSERGGCEGRSPGSGFSAESGGSAKLFEG